MTFTNLGVVIFVIVAGATKIDFRNWQLPAEEIPEGFGDGGFLPYGFGGVIKGAAICFYGFIGFDVIATAGSLLTFILRNIICLDIIFRRRGEKSQKSYSIGCVPIITGYFHCIFWNFIGLNVNVAILFTR